MTEPALSKLTDADMEWLANVNTRPGSGVGEKIDPMKPGPESLPTPTSADGIEEMREALAVRSIPPDRQDRFEQITQEVVDRWYIDSGRPYLASSYKIKWPRYDDVAGFENNARALWEELGLHADDKTCIAILTAALERAAALALPDSKPDNRGGA